MCQEPLSWRMGRGGKMGRDEIGESEAFEGLSRPVTELQDFSREHEAAA